MVSKVLSILLLFSDWWRRLIGWAERAVAVGSSQQKWLGVSGSMCPESEETTVKGRLITKCSTPVSRVKRIIWSSLAAQDGVESVVPRRSRKRRFRLRSIEFLVDGNLAEMVVGKPQQKWLGVSGSMCPESEETTVKGRLITKCSTPVSRVWNVSSDRALLPKMA